MCPRYFHSLWRNPTTAPLAAGLVDEPLRTLVGKTDGIDKAKWVLDVGAGLSASHDVISHPSARRVAIDISAVPLKSSAGVRNVLPVVADGAALPFADERFDVVTIIDVLSIAEYPTVLLSEAARVLRIGGVLIVNAQTLDDETRTAYRLISREQGAELRAGSQFLVRFFDRDQLDIATSEFPVKIIGRAHYELTHSGHWYHPARHVHRYVALVLRRV